MRVPSPAAGIITITFIAACKYTRAKQGSSNQRGILAGVTTSPRVGTGTLASLP
jgi:hypothetical protein